MSQVISQAVPGDHIRITTDPSTEPFWLAARDHRLTTAKCADCGHCWLPPSPYCGECQSQNILWPTLPGTGTVFSFAICHRSPFPDVPDFTYVPIVVDLDGAPGARLVSNLVGVDPDEVHIGMRVTVDWNPIQGGWVLPNFRKA
jgi:uncharacterized protein